MAIEKNIKNPNSPVKEEPKIDRHGIENLRAYKHYKGGTYFVNGFGVHEKTGKTCVIYSDVYTGVIWIRLAEDFVSEVEDGIQRFTIIEKKK